MSILKEEKRVRIDLSNLEQKSNSTPNFTTEATSTPAFSSDDEDLKSTVTISNRLNTVNSENSSLTGDIEEDNSESQSINNNEGDPSSISLYEDSEIVFKGKIKELEDRLANEEKARKELQEKLSKANHEKTLAVKDKETMVMKYAISEKNVLGQRHLKDDVDKKCKELTKENEILQHKLQTMLSEKNRICHMLDDKHYEHKNVQQELDKLKVDFSSLESKLKWSQNGLKSEIESHKDTKNLVESLKSQLKGSSEQITEARTELEEQKKLAENAHEIKRLDAQAKELQASLILIKHEKEERDQHIKTLRTELDRLQNKQQSILDENNNLSLRIQQLEMEKLESDQKMSELKSIADKQTHDAADLQSKTNQLEQAKLLLAREQDELNNINEKIGYFKQRNIELETDIEICREREAEMLLFTQQLTDKNVKLQSEFTSMENRVQQLTCEVNKYRRMLKEHDIKLSVAQSQLSEERVKNVENVEELKEKIEKYKSLSEELQREVTDQKGENSVIKRKLELSLREVQKELNHTRKRLEHYENGDCVSSSSSNTSLNNNDKSESFDQVKVIQAEEIDKHKLIEHIVKLQRISAKKSEKLDFLEEHVHTLIGELQKKTQLLQSYVLREQTGALTSNKMDSNKAHIAKQTGIMASLYSSRISDNNMTLELSLDINRKLQAVLEDALLKNITLKGNVDTLGAEIDRLNSLIKP